MNNYGLPMEYTDQALISSYNPYHTLEELKMALTKWHKPTAEHSIRVRIYAISLGLAIGLNGRDLTTLTIAAEMHDIGKLKIPANLLDKQESLSTSEWDLIQQHPIYGANIARQVFKSMPDVASCIMYHHERMDGSGYPFALGSIMISILTKIISIADTFSALTEDRPFKHARSESQAISILMNEEKSKYDQKLVRTLAQQFVKN